jgi:hypothetical protein
MFAAHLGRCAEVGLAEGNMGQAMMANQAKQVCSKMVAWAGVGQSPNQLTLRASLAGLPNVNDALKTFGPMINTFANMATQKSKPREDKIVKKQRKVAKKPAADDDDGPTELP